MYWIMMTIQKLCAVTFVYQDHHSNEDQVVNHVNRKGLNKDNNDHLFFFNYFSLILFD